MTILDIATKAVFAALLLGAYALLIVAAIEWLREHRATLPSGARPVDWSPRPGPAPSPAGDATTLSIALPRRGDLTDHSCDRACSSPRTTGHDNYLGDLNCVDGEWMVSRPAVDFDAAVQRFGSPEWPEPESFASATHTVRRVDRLSRYTDRTIA